MSAIQILRNSTKAECFDFSFLMRTFQDYSKPRDVVTRLLETGDIIRIKKGLYIFGVEWRRKLSHPFSLANIIFGPSYVSRESALEYYGLIPEAVKEITSMTTERKKSFSTPLGLFSYHHLRLDRYQIGIDLLNAGTLDSFLIATKEKAIVDLLYFHKDPSRNVQELFEVLTEGYRIEPESLALLDLTLTEQLVDQFSNKSILLLPKVIEYVR